MHLLRTAGGFVSALAVPCLVVQAALFSSAPGVVGPPGTLGPWPLATLADDPRPVGSLVQDAPTAPALTFDRPGRLLAVGNGWTSWSHGYAGDLYYFAANELVIDLPPGTMAIGLSLQPNLVAEFPFAVTADGTTIPVTVDGDGGAQFVGFWSNDPQQPIAHLRIWDVTSAADGFAVADLSVFVIPEPAPSTVVLGTLALAGVLFLRRPRLGRRLAPD